MAGDKKLHGQKTRPGRGVGLTVNLFPTRFMVYFSAFIFQDNPLR